MSEQNATTKTCRYCKLVVFVGRGNITDQKCQEQGLCSQVCAMLFREEMEYDLDRMEACHG